MPLTLRLLIVVLVTSVSSPAKAQLEYFTNGKAGVGDSGVLFNGDGQRVIGGEIEVMVTPRFGAAIGYGQTEVEISDLEMRSVDVLTLGVQAFPIRQHIDGPLTIGLGMGFGRLSEGDVTTVNVGVQAARVVGGTELVIQLVPKVEAALALAFSEDSAASQSVGIGIGIALRASPDAVLFIEPTVTFSSGTSESVTLFGAAFGIGLSI